jgi:hypothetical protein
MGASWAGPALTAIGILITIGFSIGGTIWMLRGRFETVKEETRREFADHLERSEHDCGETIRALRAKVEQVEFWVRDTIVAKLHKLDVAVTKTDARNEAVIEAIDRFGHVIDTMDKKIDSRFGRLENKIDAIDRTGT